MSIIKQTVPYEALVRFVFDDATKLGEYKASHYQEAEILVDTATGEILRVVELPPRPLHQGDVAGIVGAQAVNYVGQINALTSALAAKEQELEDLAAAKTAGETQHAGAVADLAAEKDAADAAHAAEITTLQQEHAAELAAAAASHAAALEQAQREKADADTAHAAEVSAANAAHASELAAVAASHAADLAAAASAHAAELAQAQQEKSMADAGHAMAMQQAEAAHAAAMEQAAQAHAAEIAALQAQIAALTPPDDTSLRGYAAAKRFAIETGGVNVGDVVFPSDRESQAKLMGAFLLTQANPSAHFKWKVASGAFVDLTGEALQGVAIAVGAHVQAAFAMEAAAVAAIDAGDAITEADVDTFFQ